MEDQLGNQIETSVTTPPPEVHALTEDLVGPSETALQTPLTEVDVDAIGREMDSLQERKVFDVKAQLARLKPRLIRIKRKGYDAAATVDWLRERGIQTSVSSVSRATATGAQRSKGPPSA